MFVRSDGKGFADKPREDLMKECGYCGIQYQVQCSSRMNRSKYCSRSCRQLGRWDSGEPGYVASLSAARDVPRSKPKWKPRLCESCGNSYTPSGQKQRWCVVCVPDDSWQGRASRYGVTTLQWGQLLETQGGTCALCDEGPKVVDHCHRTGKTRGLLCYSCNMRIHPMEDEEWIRKVRDYLALFQ